MRVLLNLLLSFIMLSSNAGDDFGSRVIPRIMEFEGGYSNHSNDSGGKTMYGITHGTLKIAVSGGIVSNKPIAALTKQDAKEIYRSLFWFPSGASVLPYPMNLVHMDTAVHHGVPSSIKMLQTSINEVMDEPVLSVDGILGDSTISLMNQEFQSLERQQQLCEKMLAVRIRRLRAIVSRDKMKRVFLRNWESRIQKLHEAIDRFYMEGI